MGVRATSPLLIGEGAIVSCVTPGSTGSSVFCGLDLPQPISSRVGNSSGGGSVASDQGVERGTDLLAVSAGRRRVRVYNSSYVNSFAGRPGLEL